MNQVVLYQRLRDIARPDTGIAAPLHKGHDDVRGLPLVINVAVRLTTPATGKRCGLGRRLALLDPQQMAQRRQVFVLMSDDLLGLSNASVQIADEG